MSNFVNAKKEKKSKKKESTPDPVSPRPHRSKTSSVLPVVPLRGAARAVLILDKLRGIPSWTPGGSGLCDVGLVKNQENRAFVLKSAYMADVCRAHASARLERERDVLTAVTALPQAHTVSLVDAMRCERRLYLLCSMALGGTLNQALATHGVLSEEYARFYTSELILALGALHKAQIVHGALCPEHVGLDQAGHVMLLGFGASRRLDADNAHVDADADGAETWLVRGVPAFTAPECLRGSAPRPASDMFALGCVVHEMLSGVPPFYASIPEDTYALIVGNKPTWAPKDALPNGARDLIRALLTPDPQKRPTCSTVQEQKWLRGVNWSKVASWKDRAPLADACAESASAIEQMTAAEGALAVGPAVGPPFDINHTKFPHFS